MSSPFGFMAYLRFHQVPSPMTTTASGKNTTLSQNIRVGLWPVILSGLVFGLFGPNRNQVLIRGKPVHHVEQQVAVAQGVGAHQVVLRELRGTHHDKAARSGSGYGPGGRERQRALLAFLGIDRATGADIGNGEAVLGSAEQFLDGGFTCRT